MTDVARAAERVDYIENVADAVLLPAQKGSRRITGRYIYSSEESPATHLSMA